MRLLPQTLPSGRLPKPAYWTRALLGVFTFAFGGGIAIAAPSTTVMVSQLYGGGGNTGAPFKNDFVELHNISTSSVSVAGWSIQYASAAGTSWTVAPLTGSIAPGGYFLVRLGPIGSVGSDLPNPDVLGNTSLNMSGTVGKIALVSNSTSLAPTDFSGTAPTGSQIVDFVGYGATASIYEGTGKAPAPSNSTAIFRANFGSTDSDENATDFLTPATAPIPRNSTSPVFPADTVSPSYVSTIPVDDAINIGVASPLSITFSEPIIKGTGNVTIKKTSDNSTAFIIDVSTAAVTTSGQTATITLPSVLSGSTEFYVLIDGGAFKDAANNLFAGISSTSAWSFTTTTSDSIPPSVTTLSPADDASGVNPSSNLVVTYSEDLLAGSGNILIKKSSDNSIVETVVAPGPRVTVTGSTLTVDPTALLDFSTGYYVEVAAGVVTDTALNPNPAITGASAWNFTTASQSPVLISQYYEGTGGGDRYIELVNTTASPITLDNYRLTVWSNSDTPGNQGWKSGTQTTARVTVLDGLVIPANGNFLVADSGANLPQYAAVINDLVVNNNPNPGATAFSGSQSIVLYSATNFDVASIADAVSFVGSDGTNTSFYRTNNLIGYDLTLGTSILNYPGTWSTTSLATVAAAAEGAPEYLKASKPAVFVSVSSSLASFSEGAGTAAATLTLTRTGPTTASADVLIVSSDISEATVEEFATFDIGESSIQIPINAIDDDYLDGSKVVTITVSATGYIPGSTTVTVTDEVGDLPFPLVINEVDSDVTGSDTTEFIELYNTSNTDLDLSGVVVVLYNGSNDLSYDTIDLTGITIPANDRFFVIGSATVPNVDLVEFTTDGIQNGADAVALHLGSPSEFPVGTAVGANVGSLIDAVVYDTADADDTGLLSALTPGHVQVDEDLGANAAINAIARSTDGGTAFNTEAYITQLPTPGATNVISVGNTFTTWASTNSVTGGVTGDHDNDGVKNAVEYFFGATGSTFTANPQPVAGVISFPYDATATQATYKVWTSDNLATWTDVTASTVIEAGFVKYTLPTGAGKLFVRLEVIVTP
jgi:predicted extracellular nuclease